MLLRILFAEFSLGTGVAVFVLKLLQTFFQLPDNVFQAGFATLGSLQVPFHHLNTPGAKIQVGDGDVELPQYSVPVLFLPLLIEELGQPIDRS